MNMPHDTGLSSRRLKAESFAVYAGVAGFALVALVGLLGFAAWLFFQVSRAAAAVALIATFAAAGAAFNVLLRWGVIRRYLAMRSEIETAQRQRDETVAAMQEKARLFATMSHEIRTPLNGVIGMLNLLRDTELTPEQENYVATAHGSGRTLLSFIDEILDGARSEALHEGKATDVDLLALVEGVTELLAPRAHAKGIDIAARVDPALPPTLRLDDMRLRQLLFNLAGNAIKFTAEGGVMLSLARGAAGALVIQVTDTGIGMSKAEQAKIFDAYAQANADTQKTFGGTGLGLAISRNIVADWGGSLTVASVPGEGSTFTATLPGLVSEMASPLPSLPLTGRRYCLAIADAFTSRALAQALEDLGATVTVDQGDAEAVIADADAAADIIKSTRGRGRFAPPAQLWLFLSPEERRPLQALAKSVSGYLLKPVRRSTLIERLGAADASALQETRARLEAAKKRKQAIASLRVLVADDTPVNAFVARAILQRAGHKVLVVDSGRGAIEAAFAGEAFDILLLDMEMPGMDGPEAAGEIRRLEAQRGGTSRLPILALTANARPEAAAACIAAGMDGHLPKPFDHHDLHEAIARLTRKSAA